MCLERWLGRWYFARWNHLKLEKEIKTDENRAYRPVFCPLTGDNETGRAGGEWSSAVRRGVAAAEGAGRHAGWGGRGRAGGRAEELG